MTLVALAALALAVATCGSSKHRVAAPKLDAIIAADRHEPQF